MNVLLKPCKPWYENYLAFPAFEISANDLADRGTWWNLWNLLYATEDLFGRNMEIRSAKMNGTILRAVASLTNFVVELRSGRILVEWECGTSMYHLSSAFGWLVLYILWFAFCTRLEWIYPVLAYILAAGGDELIHLLLSNFHLWSFELPSLSFYTRVSVYVPWRTANRKPFHDITPVSGQVCAELRVSRAFSIRVTDPAEVFVKFVQMWNSLKLLLNSAYFPAIFLSLSELMRKAKLWNYQNFWRRRDTDHWLLQAVSSGINPDSLVCVWPSSGGTLKRHRFPFGDYSSIAKLCDGANLWL